MIVISKSKLAAFYEREGRAKESLLIWYHTTTICDWENYHEMKETFNSVDSIGNDRYVFNVRGNKYRIVAMIHFKVRTYISALSALIRNMIKLTVKQYEY